VSIPQSPVLQRLEMETAADLPQATSLQLSFSKIMTTHNEERGSMISLVGKGAKSRPNHSVLKIRKKELETLGRGERREEAREVWSGSERDEEHDDDLDIPHGRVIYQKLPPKPGTKLEVKPGPLMASILTCYVGHKGLEKALYTMVSELLTPIERISRMGV
ncbi:unnamed protein product, partial [Dovyalis caffra]